MGGASPRQVRRCVEVDAPLLAQQTTVQAEASRQIGAKRQQQDRGTNGEELDFSRLIDS